MHVERLPDGRLRLSFEIDEGDRLAEAVIKHAEEASSAALALSSILREARYEARNDFRQPRNAWAPGIRHPSA